MSFAARLARECLPPVLFRALRCHVRLPGQIRWPGDYEDWSSAAALSAGYDEGSILDKVVAATRAVVRGDAAYERDSKTFYEIHYSWPLLASLMCVAATRGSLRVLDFGGSLGTTMRQNSRYLSLLRTKVQWRIVEQPAFIEAGKLEFEDSTLSFHRTIEDACRGGVDVALLANVLNYVERPEEILGRILEAGAPYLILDRTMLTDRPRDHIGIQIVPSAIYKASYTVRRFSRPRFLADLQKRWRIVEQWTCDLQPDPHSTSYGFFCARL
jgi:putative methyltransferase (TIGR04325 family)